MIFRSQDLSTRCAHCCRGITGPQVLSMDKAIAYMSLSLPHLGSTISCLAPLMLDALLTPLGSQQSTQAAPPHRCHLIVLYLMALGLNLGGREKKKKEEEADFLNTLVFCLPLCLPAGYCQYGKMLLIFIGKPFIW